MRIIPRSFPFQVLLLLLVAGCVTDPKSTLCLLASLTTVDGGNTVTQTYAYSDGRLIAMVSVSGGDSVQTNYQYDPTGDLSKTTRRFNGQSLVTTFAFDSLHLVRASISGFNGDTTEVFYRYNDTYQLIRRDQILTLVSGSVVKDTLYYTYPDATTHNPSIIATVTLTDSVVVHYTYDNKINPEREHFLPNIQPFSNITGVTAPTYSYTISYQYDSHGYPLSATWSTGRAQTWTYSCQEL